MKITAILCSVAITALMLIAVADNPYSYYQFLRVATVVLTGFIAYAIYQHNEESKFIWFFIAVAVLFNPFVPIYLDKGTWTVIDLAVAVSAPVVTFLALRAKSATGK